jgi:shikimate kinase/3-dehydroquinate synthase|nr:3-dehydroquinate synthase [Kofleriaceae bacterium]
MLFLIGFMAAGKTSVGRALAARSSRRFVDLDDVIDTGGESVAQLVARDEPEFRRREAAALAKAIASAGDDDVVIATGGGAATHGDNLARMRAAGFVVALGVDVAEARRRADGGPPRPLLAYAEEVAATRAPVYRRAHACIDTTGRVLDDVVDHVAAAEHTWRALPPERRDATIVALGDRTYPVCVSDALDGELVRAHLPRRAALITDDTVAKLWMAQTTAALGIALDIITVAPGEASKSLRTYQRVCEELIARGIDRGCAIVALGGGVVGDLAGFVAATLFRGIPVVQIPTTLVAMTDAAIGGKTAVDLPAGKNLIGAFHQPRLVACALETLATLPDRERRAGFGELWKYALLDGDDMWRAVDACAAWSAAGGAPPGELAGVIARAIAYKAAIVSRDEREQTGHRALLNLGHTIGHAIESASSDAAHAEHHLLHGEAVALGLIAACRVARHLAGSDSQDLEPRVREALRRSGLSDDLDRWLTDAVLARVSVDKKRVGATIRFIVPRGVGACEPVEVGATELQRILRSDSHA